MKKTRLFPVFAVCAAMLFAGCSNGTDEPATYTVTVTSGGNGSAAADKTTAKAGTTVNLTATSDPGCDFVGWTVESGGAILSPNATSNKVVFTMPAGNVVIKAEFALTKYFVVVTSGGNGIVIADKGNAAKGETVELTAMPDPGYSFDKWTVESGGVTLTDPATNPATFTMPAGNVSIKADFIQGVRINGMIWALYNVDAPGTFAANPEDYGMFYQWNRRTGWSTTDPMVDSNGGMNWDSSNAAGDEWEAANDPCPAGWRVPTHEEQVALCDAEKPSTWTTLNGVSGRKFTDNVSENSVFFPNAGYRHFTSGAPTGVGSNGYYWSETPSSAIYAHGMRLDGGAANPQSSATRAYGFAVRCVAE